MSEITDPIPIYTVHLTPERHPLSLGLLLAYIRKNFSQDQFISDLPIAFSEIELNLQIQQYGTGIVLFSDYMWNVENNLELSFRLKQSDSQHVVIHGGPSVPAYPDACKNFLTQHSHIDYAIRGEGEQTLVELLKTISTKKVPHLVEGLSFMDKGQLVQTSPRPRAVDLDIYPSPYLTGIFDRGYQDWFAAIMETNRGCPYGCTFCDWGSATLQKIRLFSLERVKAEIDWMGRHKIVNMWLADANFGILKRDVEIAKFLCETKKKYGYPNRIVVNYAKNTHENLVNIVEMFIKAGLVATGSISLQTRDQQTLKAIRRTNIKTKEYDKLKQVFYEKRLPLSSQLMIGLPGSTLESFKEDLKTFVFEDIEVMVFRTVVLPNSPMADPDYIKEFKIKVNKEGLILSSSTFSEDELTHMDMIARLFRCAHTFGMMRYLLCFLWWDYSIEPIEFLEKLSVDIKAGTSYPLLNALYDQTANINDLLNTHVDFRHQFLNNNLWFKFYQQLGAYIQALYQVNEAALNSVLELQSALMPAISKQFPLRVEIAFDFIQYYQEHLLNRGKKLELYLPGSLTVSDPFGICTTGLVRQAGLPAHVWQLNSELPTIPVAA